MAASRTPFWKRPFPPGVKYYYRERVAGGRTRRLYYQVVPMGGSTRRVRVDGSQMRLSVPSFYWLMREYQMVEIFPPELAVKEGL